MRVPMLRIHDLGRGHLAATRWLILAVGVSLALFEILHRYVALPPLVTATILAIVYLPILVLATTIAVLLLLSDPDEFAHGLRYAFALLLLSVFFFAVIYTELGIIEVVGGPHVTNNFWTCLYFSIVTFTTIGYGDFAPSVAARPVAALEALFGYALLGITVAATFYLLVARGEDLRRHRSRRRADRGRPSS